MNEESNAGSERLDRLRDAGVSVWLDDLSRERLASGNLEEMVERRQIVGVTTNPSIFASALAEGERYDDQVAALTRAGASVDDVIIELTTDDVRWACDVLAPVYEATDGVDGRVSIEVAPTLAFDTEATLEQAVLLWRKVDRPNLLVKIPATTEGLPAVSAALGQGISVNVTLIFGLARYEAVMAAYLDGLEQARTSGVDLSMLHSVASFFISRVDSEVDRRLAEIGTPEALELKGKAALANARLAHKRFEEVFSGQRFEELRQHGARAQRPLWASTGVKNTDYPDTLYVSELVTADTVNTMPEKTLEAFSDHGEVEGDRVRTSYDDAQHVMDRLADLGISYDDVIEALEQEGVDKFVDSWHELTATVDKQMSASRGDQA